MKKFLCICLSATLQKTVRFGKLEPAKVNRSEHYRLDPSGKAINSARVLNQLEQGCGKILCPLGKENIDQFLKLASRDNLDIAYVEIPGYTRECLTLLDKERATTTELVISENKPDSSETEKIQTAEIKLLKYLNEILPETDGVILAGSRPAGWSEDLYQAICGIVKDRGKTFLADYIGKDLTLTLEGAVPDIIKINDEEFSKTFGYEYPLEEDRLKKEICSKSQELGNIIVITRGVESTLAANKGRFYECQSEKVEAVNTTACGDSFNAGFFYEYLNNDDTEENFQQALRKGTWCAARNAETEVPGSIKKM